MVDKKFNSSIIILLFVFLALVSGHVGTFIYDYDIFKGWAINIRINGLARTYYIWNDYLPVFQYLLRILVAVFGTVEDISRFFIYVKVFPLCFEFLGLWYVSKWIDKKTTYLTILLLCMLNICYSYNTIVWGQFDAIHTTLAFIAIYYAYNNKMVLSMLSMILALNMKVQAIIFIPILMLLYLYSSLQTGKWVSLIWGICAAALLQYFLAMPFYTDDARGVALIWQKATSVTNTYPLISASAKNFWSYVVPTGELKYPDTNLFIGNITYRSFGLILFFLSSFFAMLPLMKVILGSFRKNSGYLLNREKIWLSCALIAILFFFFNTQMHERYAHPAFIFIAAYAFYRCDFIPFILFSIAYVLSLEPGMIWMNLPNYKTFIFQDNFVATMYLLTAIYLFVKLYMPSKKTGVVIG